MTSSAIIAPPPLVRTAPRSRRRPSHVVVLVLVLVLVLVPLPLRLPERLAQLSRVVARQVPLEPDSGPAPGVEDQGKPDALAPPLDLDLGVHVLQQHGPRRTHLSPL